MNNITTIGIDLAKNVFQLHGVDALGKVVLKKRVKRHQLLDVMRSLPRCLVGMEACGSANYWARELIHLGHEVKLMSPQHVKPYIGSVKNDYRDAAGICEAVSRPRMLFVPLKTTEQQDIQSLHRIRSRLVAERTALANQVRGLLAEYGVVMPKGIHNVPNRLPKILEDASNALTPAMRELMSELYEEYVMVDARVTRMTAKLETISQCNELCQKILPLEGIGPICATALIAAVGNGQAFQNGRQMAAWLGLTPRQYSSGDKVQLSGISKRGDRHVRYLLIHGARSVVRVCHAKRDAKSRWVDDKVTRRGKNKAAVALANKTARTVWALLTKPARYERVA